MEVFDTYAEMNSARRRAYDGSSASELRAAVVFLRGKLWLIILCFLVAGSVGAIYLNVSPKTYRAQAVIQAVIEPEPGAEKGLKAESADPQDLKGEEITKTIEQSLTSPELLLGLIVHNDLARDPQFLPGMNRPGSGSKMADELAKHISTQVRHGTRLIDIRVEDQSPLMAQKIADLVIKEFIQENFRRHMEGSQTLYNLLLQQAERLKAKLAKSEEALQAYREENQAVGLGEKDNITVAKLAELNRMVTEAKATRLKLEPDYLQIRKLGMAVPAALLAIPAIANSPAVLELQKTVTQKDAEVATLTQMYKAGHPIHTAALRQLQELKAGLDRTIRATADEVTRTYESAGATEKKMEEALYDQERVALELNKKTIAFKLLNQEVESDRTLYESILGRLKQTDLTKDVTQSIVRVVSHPLLPEQPVSPSKTRVALLSIVGGLALGCGLSLLSAFLDRSLKSVDEAERQLGLPALGVVPKCARPKWLTDDLLLIEQPGSLTAESFRSLRTSLSLLGKGPGHKAFLFTSAVAGEGKSFCAVNCAVAFSQQGIRTLLIDADLRSPSIDTIFFDGAPIQGLAEILMRQTNLDDATRPTNIDKLSVLCAGSHTHTPSELLASEALGQLVQEAMTKYDRVVVDSAPVQAVSDTLLLVGHVPATCLVVSAHTAAEIVCQAVRKLDGAGSTLVGFVFNRVSRQQGGDHSYRSFQVACARANAANRKRAGKSSPQLPESVLQNL